MSDYCFDDFRFNTKNHRLSKQGELLPLRPKTAQLLALFIQNPGRLFSKRELITEIWGSPNGEEQGLFQLISELRKLPAQYELIRTQPNQGYCWVANTREVRHRQKYLWLSAAAAACLLVGVVTALNFAKQPEPFRGMPGLQALSEGALSLQGGNPKEAGEWLTFALTENPQSLEARLLLAESLYQQGRLVEASDYLGPVLDDHAASPLHPSSYDKMVAAELMSRIYQQNGKLEQALEFARKGLHENVQAQCTVALLDDRISYLEKVTGEASDSSLSSAVEASSKKTQDPEYNTYCNQLQPQSVIFDWLPLGHSAAKSFRRALSQLSLGVSSHS